jgi:aldehyde dehydrogenase (NAD+)
MLGKSDLITALPFEPGTLLSPLANKPQFEKVQRLIYRGINRSRRAGHGGSGTTQGVRAGLLRKADFSGVQPHMTIAREEICGPVLSIMPYQNGDEAITIANDTIYGLGARVSSRVYSAVHGYRRTLSQCHSAMLYLYLFGDRTG